MNLAFSLLLQGVICDDITNSIGKTSWWDTNIDQYEFNRLAQDPAYVYSDKMSQDMHGEHYYNTITESKYLMDTQKNRFDDLSCGITNQEVLKMLINGGDFVGFRNHMDKIINGDKSDAQSRELLGFG